MLNLGKTPKILSNVVIAYGLKKLHNTEDLGSDTRPENSWYHLKDSIAHWFVLVKKIYLQIDKSPVTGIKEIDTTQITHNINIRYKTQIQIKVVYCDSYI